MITTIPALALALALPGLIEAQPTFGRENLAKGDYNGDGSADFAVLVRRTNNTHDLVVRFAANVEVVVARRVDPARVRFASVPSTRLRAICAKHTLPSDMCSPRATSHDALSFRDGNSVPGLAVWTGRDFVTAYGVL